MAQKNIKSVGNILGQSKEYWSNAAKQMVWPIDFEHKHILVPEKDLELAADNLMISHFRAHGWHVQSAIVEYNKPYIAPVSDKPIFLPVKKEVIDTKEPEFKFNQLLKIASTGTELKIISIDKKSIELKYVGIDRPNIQTTPENLSQSVRRGIWLKV